MGKYINVDKDIDLDKLEERYKDKIGEAEKAARKAADELLEEIRFYKNHTYDELMDLCLKTPTEESKKIFWWFDEGFVPATKKFGELEPWNKSRDYIKKTDILYDMMTEEQVDKYIELFYLTVLKENLADERSNAAWDAIKERAEGKELRYNDYYHGNNYNSGLFIQERRKEGITPGWNDHVTGKRFVKEIARLEADGKEETDKKLSARAKIKIAIGGAKATVPTVGLPMLIAIFTEDISNPAEFIAGCGIAGMFMFATLCASFGVYSYRDFRRSKKAVEEAKKLGIYDLLVEYFKVKKEFDEYEHELIDEYVLKDEENDEKGDTK